MIHRRQFTGALLLPLAAASFDLRAESRPGLARQLAEIEKQVGGRLGVHVLDTADGRRAGHRQDERFALCSTFKFLAAALVLARVDQGKERLDRRVKRFIGHLESWVGPLETEQRALVIERYHQLADYSEELMGERKYRQTEIFALVKSRPTRARMEAGLRRVLVETDSWRRPEYAQKLRERDLKFHTMVADLSATLTERQRVALQKRIRGFLRDISTLTANNASQRSPATAAS